MRPERVAYEEEEKEEEDDDDGELLFQQRERKDRRSFHKRTSQRGRVNRVAFPSPVISLLFPPSGQERAYQRRRPSFEEKKRKKQEKREKRGGRRTKWEGWRGRREEQVEEEVERRGVWPVNGVIILSRFKGSTWKCRIIFSRARAALFMRVTHVFPVATAASLLTRGFSILAEAKQFRGWI